MRPRIRVSPCLCNKRIINFALCYSPYHWVPDRRNTTSFMFIHRSLIIVLVTSGCGVEFGEMMTFISMKNYVLHIEVDLLGEDRLLFIDGSSLNIANGNIKTTLVGSAKEYGYAEGWCRASRFDQIGRSIHLNATTLLLPVVGGHCLRILSGLTLMTSKLVGHCRTSGFWDGISALLYWTIATIKAVRSPNKCFITDIVWL